MTSLLSIETTLLLVIDIQEKFKPILFNAAGVVKNASRLIQGCRLLEVPILVTEQYPQGLGETLPELKTLLAKNTPVMTKTAFGCYDDSAIATSLKKANRSQIMVCGLEAHVCVNQTVVRLLETGYQVCLVQDAIGARNPENFDIAVQKLTQLGALPYSVEMALFELMRTSRHPVFKSVQALIR